ncbi:rhamnogalacturonan lyase [Pseudoduganella umbonata]|uniref:Rhamnogalacturonan endolyase n=1 Tax=Pseudoduganella umbonata TaxID=864828 RepID=A0A4V1ED35_9BURK|nr:rhamnogalacturonan lyase [Pseudoduganella umbonata]MBB3219637.1 rhamnogalacturonan endolyase [Pseudoduganella umbonata]QCP09701.1 rhamnogalacturonan lyase [Pseudoduganella umbonata]
MNRPFAPIARPTLIRPIAPIALLSLALLQPAFADQGRKLEKLDRGAVAIGTGTGSNVFVSWRVLGTDDPETRFNLYRDDVKLNAEPLEVSNFTDTAGSSGARYLIRPVVKGKEKKGQEEYALATWSEPVLRIPLQQPEGGVTPAGAYTYEMNDGTTADLDGDGKYELVVKWQPTNAKDNSQSGHTGNTYIDAYRLDGTRLWRIDLGRNIRAGAHYTTMVVYDLDGNGKAEVMVKTADGTVDGRGTVIGDPAADYRNSAGYVLTGPEFLTVFDGRSGKALATTDYLPARGTVSSWGDNYGNRVDRFLGGVAYLDGTRPSAIFSRGYYTRAVIAAWDYRDGQLTSRWVFDTNNEGAEARGQGAHWFSVADVNEDGRDDIIYGAATIGSDGHLMYSTGLCHGDALHVGKFDPARPGQQIYMVHESPSCYKGNGASFHDAATGALLWGAPATVDVGRGVCYDIDPAYPGAECWASRGGLFNVSGQQISTNRPGSMNFASWWDGDLLRESLDGTTISKWNPATFAFENLLAGAAYNAASNNGTKATPVLSADILGDWREEVVWRTADNSELLVFSTTIPTAHRIPTLMHDAQYRVQVAGQNAGYNQPPHTSFYLGEGATPPVPGTVQVAE